MRRPFSTARFVPVLLAVAVVSGIPATAEETVFSQQSDGRTTFASFTTSTTNQESADDFYVVGDITRAVFHGSVSFTTTGPVDGVTVRFFEVGPDGGPGALQAEYFLPDGDPNLSYDPAQPNDFDVVLSPPFVATGRHWVAFQVGGIAWYWWSADNLRVRDGRVHVRSDGGPWSEAISPFTGQPEEEDLTYTLYGTPTAPGRIDAITPDPAPLSGLVTIRGANFGGGGSVAVGGVAAFATTWTDSAIKAYVPESAAPGLRDVAVTTSGGTSAPVPVDVVDRVPDGRLRWRFEMDAPYSRVRPVAAPDGTIYAVDVYAHLYALTPDGGLKWAVNGAGGKGVAVGQDGKVYAGSERTIKAYFPDGSPAWTFVQDPAAFILVGVSVGPDGNVYAVATNGLGVFSLTPDGDLRWNDPESYSRPIVDYGEIVFGPNGSKQQLYFYANAHDRALELGGSPKFTFGRGQPSVAPDATVHISDSAYSPNGDLLWTFSFPLPGSGLTAADVGPDSRHYVVQSTNRLYAIRPGGVEDWNRTFDRCLGGPIVGPSNDVIALGTCDPLNVANAVIGASTADGAELWRVDLPVIEGYNEGIGARARFSRDGRHAYVESEIATGDNATSRSWINAVDATPQGPCTLPPETTGLGVLADRVRVRWDAQVGAAGYDVERGSLATLASGAPATCMANDLPDPWYDDVELPAAGEGWYYLSRSVDACGPGTWGSESTGIERSGDCP